VIATTEAAQRFGVVCVKADGRRTLFARYGTRDAAESAARALRAHALRAEVIEGDELPTEPGTSIVETRA
jgi:hypothetical protein